MRKMWTTGAAIVMCLALGGLPALAQEASPTGGAPTTASPAATPGPVTVVEGAASCSADLDWTTDPDGTQHVRDGTFICTVTTDDPRVGGTETASWNIDLWGSPESTFSLVQWGTSRLENAGGAWQGWGSGVASQPGYGDIIAFWYAGTGDYAGLSYLEQWTGSDPWAIQGLIFPGDPPTP